MAEKKTTQPKSKHQGVKGAYYIVNPAGAVHSVTREHATTRLQQVGYRLATDEEIEKFKSSKIQRAGRPIAEPWSPVPPEPPEVPETEE
jgi:hypothetical protein